MAVERASYSAKEVAELLGWSVDDVYYHCRHDPNFPHLRSGRTILIPRRRFEAWLNGGEAPPQQPKDSAATQH